MCKRHMAPERKGMPTNGSGPIPEPKGVSGTRTRVCLVHDPKGNEGQEGIRIFLGSLQQKNSEDYPPGLWPKGKDDEKTTSTTSRTRKTTVEPRTKAEAPR